MNTKLVYQQYDDEFTYVLTHVETANQSTTITLEQLNRDGSFSPSEKLRITPEGLFRIELGIQQIDPPCCSLETPNNVGLRWKSSFKFSDEQFTG